MKKRKKQSSRGSQKFSELLDDNERRLYVMIKKGINLPEISREFNIPKEEVFPLIDKLRAKGFDVVVENNGDVFLRNKLESNRGRITKLPPITKKTVKFLVLSDLCLGLKKQQGDLLETAYAIGEKEEVFFAIICGNLIAGKPKKKNENEYFLDSADDQVFYAVDVIPRASFKTYFINGPNELSFQNEDGHNIGELLASQRDDLRYCGDWETIFEIGKRGTKVAFLHSGGRQAYTKSYPLQSILENYQEAETYVFEGSEPLKSVFVGGLNTLSIIPHQLPLKKELVNNFSGVAVPCLYRITSTERTRVRRGGPPVLGCLIVTMDFDEEGSLKSIIYDARIFTAYHKDDGYLEDVKLNGNFAENEKEILCLLEGRGNRGMRKGELARKIGKSVENIESLISDLTKKGYRIDFSEERKAFILERKKRVKFETLDFNQMYVKRVKVGAFSDTHIGHEEARVDLIPQVYTNSEERKVDHILHCGNVFEGEDSYAKQRRELIFHGADNQRDYALKIWPKSLIATSIISESGQEHGQIYKVKSGHDIVDTFVRLLKGEKGIQNVHYLGGHKGVVEINGIKFILFHPAGGMPYGMSYRLQRIIEKDVQKMAIQTGAKIIFAGHLHVATCLFYKGMAGFLVPCLEEATEYISSHGYTPWLGMWICEFHTDNLNNITRIVSEYIPFEPKKLV